MPLIDRLLGIFVRQGASDIVVICNDISPLVRQHLVDIQHNGLQGMAVPLRFVVKSTPSSMHSLYELTRLIGDERFCLTTVDTVFREEEFAAYIDCFRQSTGQGDYDGVMGLTGFVDDEKPLYVGTDGDELVTGFYDDKGDRELVSGGIYGLTPAVLPTLQRCIEGGMSRMRNFQRAMVADGLRLRPYRFSKVLDVDHVDDIAKAESFLNAARQ